MGTNIAVRYGTRQFGVDPPDGHTSDLRSGSAKGAAPSTSAVASAPKTQGEGRSDGEAKGATRTPFQNSTPSLKRGDKYTDQGVLTNREQEPLARAAVAFVVRMAPVAGRGTHKEGRLVLLGVDCFRFLTGHALELVELLLQLIDQGLLRFD